mmetsp:Transcript_8889/g.21960  ORF Transcript_8889/g.21960 Transcript_8889/m.21960 type:complete len:225 (-) Transcript_8889:356-1030(-)
MFFHPHNLFLKHCFLCFFLRLQFDEQSFFFKCLLHLIQCRLQFCRQERLFLEFFLRFSQSLAYFFEFFFLVIQQFPQHLVILDVVSPFVLDHLWLLCRCHCCVLLVLKLLLVMKCRDSSCKELWIIGVGKGIFHRRRGAKVIPRAMIAPRICRSYRHRRGQLIGTVWGKHVVSTVRTQWMHGSLHRRIRMFHGFIGRRQRSGILVLGRLGCRHCRSVIGRGLRG